MEHAEFNSRAGLHAHVFSREGLQQVLRARLDYVEEAAKSPSPNKPKLHTFCLFSRLLLEPDGTVSRINRAAFSNEQLKKLSMLGPIVTWQEMAKYATQNGVDITELVFDSPSASGCNSCSGGSCDTSPDPNNWPPPPKETCVICEGDWGLDNIDDHTALRTMREVPLDSRVGQTFEKVLKELRLTGCSKWFVVLRDLDPFGLYQVTAEELGQMMLENDTSGFDGTLNVVCLDDLIVPDDVLVYEGLRYEHLSCQLQQRALEETLLEDHFQARYTELFTLHGFEEVKIERAPLPEHLEQHVEQQLQGESEWAIDQAITDTLYYRIVCREGEFGLVQSNIEPYIDLHDTGLTAADLISYAPEDLMLVSLIDEDVTLLRLWQKLVKLQR